MVCRCSSPQAWVWWRAAVRIWSDEVLASTVNQCITSLFSSSKTPQILGMRWNYTSHFSGNFPECTISGALFQSCRFWTPKTQHHPLQVHHLPRKCRKEGGDYRMFAGVAPMLCLILSEMRLPHRIGYYFALLALQHTERNEPTCWHDRNNTEDAWCRRCMMPTMQTRFVGLVIYPRVACAFLTICNQANHDKWSLNNHLEWNLGWVSFTNHQAHHQTGAAATGRNGPPGFFSMPGSIVSRMNHEFTIPSWTVLNHIVRHQVNHQVQHHKPSCSTTIWSSRNIVNHHDHECISWATSIQIVVFNQ